MCIGKVVTSVKKGVIHIPLIYKTDFNINISV